jgi:hypothetical protein
VQIKRTKDGFVDAASPHVLAHPDWEFEKIYESTRALTELSHDYIREHDKTLVVGGSKSEERAVIEKTLNVNGKINEYSIRNLHQ